MALPWILRVFWMLLIFCISANIPFLMLGMVWGAISIVILSIWVASHWKWSDSPYFLMLKVWFMGLFVIPIVDGLRFYAHIQDLGVLGYINKLKWSVGLSLISLFVAGILAFGVQLLFHLTHKLLLIIEAFIDKERAKYERTWIHRRIVKARKRIRGIGWRIHNLISKFKKK